MEIPASVPRNGRARRARSARRACGLFAGSSAVISWRASSPCATPRRRAGSTSSTRREMLDVERTCDEASQAVIGVMHSHTHTTNYPSPTDIEDAAPSTPSVRGASSSSR
ncbi:MAG: Mov34/MPN/PAD-1 family protein [Acidimicrobiales bacterium]